MVNGDIGDGGKGLRGLGKQGEHTERETLDLTNRKKTPPLPPPTPPLRGLEEEHKIGETPPLVFLCAFHSKAGEDANLANWVKHLNPPVRFSQ